MPMPHPYIHKGRYGVFSDCNYNPVFSDYDPSDFDLDIPMLVADREEGDVPPGIAGPGDVVFVNDIAIAGASPRKEVGETMDQKKTTDEVRRSMEKYHSQHKEWIRQMVSNTGDKVPWSPFPLKK